MARHIEYICDACGRNVGRDNLKVKRVQFKEMGQGPLIKTRTAAWLCIIPQDDGSPSCLSKDPDYQRPLLSSSPGIVNTTSADESLVDTGT